MVSLVAGITFFVGIHLFVSGTRARDALVARLGERGYLVVFSLASLVGISWASRAYARAPYVELWGQVAGGRSLAMLLMLVAFFFFFVGLTTPGPTGPDASGLERGDRPKGILRVTRHPFLWGAALWAATHLVWNGDLASLIFFGGFLVLTLYGPVSIDAKRARRHGEAWDRFAAVSSNVPFAAVASGRASLDAGALREMGLWRVGGAIALWVASLYTHAWVFGASPFPP